MFYYRTSTKLRLSAKEFFALMECKDFIKPVHINS